MTDEQKEAAYYEAAARKEVPAFVPAIVRLKNELFGDFPFRGAGVAAGDHSCTCNRWGAVAVKDRAGELLGLRIAEFEPLVWQENIYFTEKGVSHV